MNAPPLRALRADRGLSQVALAAAAGITRQSLGAIEAGRAVPAVDVALRLARALGCTVEEAFAAPAADAAITAAPLAPAADRVALAHIDGRWIASPLRGALTAADGVVRAGSTAAPPGRSAGSDAGSTAAPPDRSAGSGPGATAAPRARRTVPARADAPPTLTVDPLAPLAEARDNLFVTGCAPALGIVADRLNRRGAGGRCVWVAASSTAALLALARRETHVAGVHLVDARTGEHNVADVRRLAGSAPVVLVTLARWEAGLVVAPGNPRAIGPESLARPGLRQVAREVGSGARRLLDATLAAAGAALPADALRAAGHLEVAHAIALGAADVGVASRDAAVAHGLGFVPLAEERYDLVIPRAALADARIERLVDLLTTAPLRRELAALGYDMRPAGDRVAAIEAA